MSSAPDLDVGQSSKNIPVDPAITTKQPSSRDLSHKESYDSQPFKFKNPMDECSVEDFCCFYFLYLLFDKDNKPTTFEIPVKGLDAPGYSYYSNMSTGSSIDSKNSLFGKHCTTDDDNEKEPSTANCDDESDGWKVSNIPPARQTMVTVHEDMIDLSVIPGPSAETDDSSLNLPTYSSNTDAFSSD